MPGPASSASQLRTLQRRLQDWRALHDPDLEVYFPREHQPGREAQFDFTPWQLPGGYHRRPALPPLLFQPILSHSGWRYAEVATGETFLGCSWDCRPACGPWAGVPKVVRSDNTSAATHEMRRSRGNAFSSMCKRNFQDIG